MVAFGNGRAPITLLTTVAPGTQLLNPVARAFKRLVRIGEFESLTIKPASEYGAGYRSFTVQGVFWRAGQGDKAAIAKTRLDTTSLIRIASPGYSTHGTATRIDMLFDGRWPDDDDLELAARYGFTREFGASDRAHFMHNGRTAISGYRAYDKIRYTAQFLNERHLGVQTNAARTGRRDRDFIYLLQHYGHLEGTYPKRCIEDGVTGPYTERSFDKTWQYVLAS